MPHIPALTYRGSLTLPASAAKRMHSLCNGVGPAIQTASQSGSVRASSSDLRRHVGVVVGVGVAQRCVMSYKPGRWNKNG